MKLAVEIGNRKRPVIPESCSEPLAKFMREGWAHAPHERPRLEDVRQQLSTVKRSNAVEDENEKLKAELKQRGTRDTFSAGKRQEGPGLDRPSKQMRLDRPLFVREVARGRRR